MLSKFREPVNSLTHLGGAVAALIGSGVLLVVSGIDLARIFAVLIYGVSLIGLFTASGIYHMVQVKPKALEIFRKLDHSAIYVLIAGSYTPFCLIAFTGFWRWGLLAIIWSLALIGIATKMFILNAPRWLHAGVYVVMGWLCIMAIGEMLAVLPAFVITWIVIGGIIYTLGAVVYVTKILNFVPGKFGFHEVWHIFVLLGAAAHFVAVTGVVV